MKHLYSMTIMLCLAGFAAASEGPAKNNPGTIPGLVRYGGQLPADRFSTGQSQVVLKFQILNDAETDTLWSEIQKVELDAKGSFQVLLGATSTGGLPKAMFEDGAARWLVITPFENVDGPPLIRTKFLSIPYAFAAANAETLGGRAPSEFVLRQEMTRDSINVRDEAGDYVRQASAYIVTSPGSNDQVIDHQGTSQLLVNRLEGLRFADRFASIQAAIDDLPASGGTVVVPIGTYIISTCIDPGASKRVILQGQGWNTTAYQAAFGNAAWLTAFSGSVLKVTGANDAICTATSGAERLILRDLAIVGPGSGKSTGIKIRNSGSTLFHSTSNVAVSNFYRCMHLGNTYGNSFRDQWFLGCGTGLFAGEGVVNNTVFYDARFSGNTQACRLQEVQGFAFKGKAGLMQANVNGCLVDPPIVGTKELNIEEMWHEGNVNYDWRFDSSAAGMSAVQFTRTHHGNGGDYIQFAGKNSHNRFTFTSVEAGGTKLTIPATAGGMTLQNTTFASVTDNSTTTVTINDNSKGTSLGPNWAIKGPSGVGLISGDASGNIKLGHNGVAANDFSVRAATYQLNNATGSLAWLRMENSSLKVYNGLMFRMYSDEGTTEKFTVNSATGAVFTVGTFTSTTPPGTAPLTVASSTKVSNLNSDQLDGADWASPLAIGSNTPALGTFTGLTIGNGGTVLTKHLSTAMTSAAWNVSASGVTCAVQTVLVSGASPDSGDTVSFNIDTSVMSVGDIMASAWISGPDRVSVRICDVTGSNPPAFTNKSLRVDVWKH
jgi:hypothetical protein